VGSSARLVVEVVSTNWQDDYLRKLAGNCSGTPGN
jgi:Uma2 family endonuclease